MNLKTISILNSNKLKNKGDKMRQLRRLTVSFLIAVCSLGVSATEQTSADEAQLRAHLAKIGVQVIDITPSTIKGLLEVRTSGGMIFSTPDGEQFIAGTLYGLNKDGHYVDVLAERQAPLNAAMIEKHKNDMIVYPAKDEKYVVTVFTDISCGYCVRLHQQMQGYNDLGITVRYLAYPRMGPSGDVASELARIWCSSDPAKSMTQSKIERNFDEKVENVERCEQVVQQQYALGRDLGLTGTPALFLPNGKLVAGYVPPSGLLQRLEQEMTK